MKCCQDPGLAGFHSALFAHQEEKGPLRTPPMLPPAPCSRALGVLRGGGASPAASMSRPVPTWGQRSGKPKNV